MGREMVQSEKESKVPPVILLTAVTLVGFLALGFNGGLLGPSLPWLAARWRVGLGDIGMLYTLLFVGACIAVCGTGLVLDRAGRKPVVVAGLLFMSAGLAGLTLVPSLLPALAASFVLGCGSGCLNVVLNLIVADLYPRSRAAALNLMNVAFGIGGLSGPLGVSTANRASGTPLVLFAGLGATALVASVAFLVLTFPRHYVEKAWERVSPLVVLSTLRERYVLLLVVMLSLYVGIEVGYGGWLYSFAIQGAGMLDNAALVVACYWLVYTLGRVGAGLVSRRVPGPYLVLGGAVLMSTGIGMVAFFSNSPMTLFVGSAMAGAGMAPIFPTSFGLATERYPTRAGVVSSLAVLGGTLGGAVLPYVIGMLLARSGVAVAAGFAALVGFGVVGLLVALLVDSRRDHSAVATEQLVAAEAWEDYSA